MKGNIIALILGMTFLVNTHSQNLKTQVQVSIYNYGDSIVSCETNFENLFKNWTVENITNAPDYKLLNYAFLETISDSIIFNDYSRYFTSNKMLGTSIKKSYHYNGTEERKFAIQPKQRNFDTFLTTKNKRVRKLYEDLDFTQEVFRMYSDDYNVNNSKVISNNYFIETDSLSDSEFKDLLLETARKERLMSDKFFKGLIKIGDLVYVIHFRYLGKLYTNYVICDPVSKNVILDSFFGNVKIWCNIEKKNL